MGIEVAAALRGACSPQGDGHHNAMPSHTEFLTLPHGHVHPDVYRTEFTLHPLCRVVHGLGVRHIGWDRKSAPAKLLQFSRRSLQSRRIARQQRDIAAVASEFRSNRAANACSGARDDHNLSQLGFLRLKLPQRGIVGLNCSNSWLMRWRAVRSALQTRPDSAREGGTSVALVPSRSRRADQRWICRPPMNQSTRRMTTTKPKAPPSPDPPYRLYP